jgi:hypothetical protein
MDATRFTNGQTFTGGGPNSEPRLKNQAWRSTLESPELREHEWRGVAGIRHRLAPRSSLGAISVNAESAIEGQRLETVDALENRSVRLTEFNLEPRKSDK